MFNWNEFKKRKKVCNNYEQVIDAMIKAAEALLDQKTILDTLTKAIEIIDEQKIDFDNGCKHNLILHFGKENLDFTANGYAECLCCQRTFYLTPEEIENENVLDLSESIPEKYLCMHDGSMNILKKRALEYLDSIQDESKHLIFLQDIKKLVLEDLIRFTEEQEIKKAHVPAPTSADYVNGDIIKRTRKQ